MFEHRLRALFIKNLAKNAVLGHFQYIFYTKKGKIKQVVCKTSCGTRIDPIFGLQLPIGILDLGLNDVDS